MKKKPNVFLRLLFILFIIFMALYIANISGYYEGRVKNRTLVTEEEIKEFEEKIQNGEDISIEGYLNNELIDYSNSISRLGIKITKSLEGIVDSSAKVVESLLNSLF